MLETARSQLEPSQERTTDFMWQGCPFMLKTATLEVKNVPAPCHGEDTLSDITTAVLAWPHSIN
jgi:hypothetical protein